MPFADLNVVLEADVQRIFLTRPEYEALLAKAKQNPQTPPPRAATLLSAQYDAKIEEGIASLGLGGVRLIDADGNPVSP